MVEEFGVYQFDELISTILTQIFACILLHIPIPDPNNDYPVAVGARGTPFLCKILHTLKLEMQATCKSKLRRSLMSLEMDTDSSQMAVQYTDRWHIDKCGFYIQYAITL